MIRFQTLEFVERYSTQMRRNGIEEMILILFQVRRNEFEVSPKDTACWPVGLGDRGTIFKTHTISSF